LSEADVLMYEKKLDKAPRLDGVKQV